MLDLGSLTDMGFRVGLDKPVFLGLSIMQVIGFIVALIVGAFVLRWFIQLGWQ